MKDKLKNISIYSGIIILLILMWLDGRGAMVVAIFFGSIFLWYFSNNEIYSPGILLITLVITAVFIFFDTVQLGKNEMDIYRRFTVSYVMFSMYMFVLVRIILWLYSDRYTISKIAINWLKRGNSVLILTLLMIVGSSGNISNWDTVSILFTGAGFLILLEVLKLNVDYFEYKRDQQLLIQEEQLITKQERLIEVKKYHIRRNRNYARRRKMK
ncbi:hypothetical protein A5881_001295 [Enterococcus termitis]